MVTSTPVSNASAEGSEHNVGHGPADKSDGQHRDVAVERRHLTEKRSPNHLDQSIDRVNVHEDEVSDAAQAIGKPEDRRDQHQYLDGGLNDLLHVAEAQAKQT